MLILLTEDHGILPALLAVRLALRTGRYNRIERTLRAYTPDEREALLFVERRLMAAHEAEKKKLAQWQ
jgi:hypothetical protein